MKLRKRILSVLCALAFSLSLLTGCGGSDSKETQTPSGSAAENGAETAEQENKEVGERPEFAFAAFGGSKMDPANAYDGWPTIRYGVAETLFKLDDELVPQPWLADSYELSEDKLTWTITLKDGITFQNGKAMDAEAVKKSLEHTLELNDRAPSDLLIDKIEADGLTVKIITSTPNAVLINNLCDPYACIIDVDTDTDMDYQPIGTGPYMVESWKVDEETVLLPYDNYWNGVPKLSRLRVIRLKDNDTMVMALQSGEVDAAYAMSYEGQALFAGDDNYKLLTVPTSRIYKLYYNLDNKNLANPNVRKALNMLIDKESYGSAVMNNNGEPATGPFPEDTPFGHDLKATGFDVEGAKALLAQEGYADTDNDGWLDKDGEKLSFHLVTYSSRAELPLLSNAIQSQCKEVGIEVTIEVSENVNDVLSAGKFDISAYAYVTMPTGDPSSYLHYTIGTDGGRNYGHYSNEKVDSLLKELDGEFDIEKRGELTREMIQIVLDDEAFCFMDHLKMSIVTKAGVSGITPHASDYYQITVDTTINE